MLAAAGCSTDRWALAAQAEILMLNIGSTSTGGRILVH